MSDLTLIAEDILNTMQAVDEAYQATARIARKTRPLSHLMRSAPR